MTDTLIPVTSTKAVVGFILAFLVSPVGLGLSIAAMRETKTGARGGHGLAVAGTVIGALGSVLWLWTAFSIVYLIVAVGSTR